MDYKIELKSVKIYESLSEETTCFTANLYINNKLVGSCKNDGCGGNTFISGKDRESNQIISMVDEWCKKNPVQEDGYVSDSLEDRVDTAIDQKVSENEEKKIQKKCISNLCFTNCKEGEPIFSYTQLGWKNVKLADMLKNPKGKEMIIKTIKTELSKGFRLLNKNIPESLYK